MQLPPLTTPWTIDQSRGLATDLGYEVRVIEGSVWKCWPHEKIAQGLAAADWLQRHVIDKTKADFAAAECRVVKVESGYDHQTAIAMERKRAKGRRRIA